MAVVKIDGKAIDLFFGYASHRRLQSEFDMHIGELLTKIDEQDFDAQVLFMLCCLCREDAYKHITYEQAQTLVIDALDKGDIGILSFTKLISVILEESHFFIRMVADQKAIMETQKAMESQVKPVAK